MATPSEKLPAETLDAGRSLYKVFATEARRYLYDTATNQILTIPEDFARYLELGVFSSTELEEFSADNRGGVLLPTSALPLAPVPSFSEVERAVHNECRLVTLEVTRDCNMRCRYCVYSGRQPGRRGASGQAMSLETAFKAVDYLQAHSSASSRAAVGFFGGEPLLNTSLLHRTTDYARQVVKGKGKDLFFSLTTNGTLLNREIMAFLAANDFLTFVSVDGPREVNDRHRVFAGSGTGTFDAVLSRLREFQQLHPEYFRRNVRLSMVAVPGTDYVRLAEWLKDHDFAASVSTQVVDDTGEFEQAYRERPVTGLDELKAQFVEAGRRGALDARRGQSEFSVHSVLFSPMLSVLRKRPVPTPPRDRSIRRGLCTPSSERLFVDCHGDLFPCEKTDGRAHLRLGHIDTGVDVRKVYDILMEFHEFMANECSSCWLWRLCQICVMGPAGETGFDRERARSACEAHRRSMAEMLKMYCTIMEHNPAGLDCLLKGDPATGDVH